MQNEQDLPIDIHSNKLLDWLVSRRLCKQDWPKGAKVIRQKINDAIQDMPPVEELTTLLSGTYINFFHCIRIVELLKETESGTRNIFGQYSSQRMKDWQEIVKLYQKDNVYLAEAAQMLIRNVNYEVPSLKKQITKSQQMQEECQRKEAEYLKNSGESKDRYQSHCRQLGIEGKNIRSELLALVSSLPASYQQISESLKNLQDSCQFYSTFRSFSLGRDDDTQLPIIRYLIEHGNTTVFEYETGKRPLKIEEPEFQLAVDVQKETDKSDAPDEIDFGDDDTIDFGIEIATPLEDVASSLNEASSYCELGVSDLGTDQNANQLDWEIVVETNGDTADVIDSTTNVARGEKALTLMDSSTTRSLLLDELFQLKAFLAQRSQEMQCEGDVLSSNRFQTAPLTLQLQTVGSVQTMSNHVQNVLTSLTNVKMQNLQLIRSSPRFVDRLVESLNQKQSLADKMLQSCEVVASRRQQVYEEQKCLGPKLELIITKTKELQGQIEREISKHYKNRPVNIMGGINTL